MKTNIIKLKFMREGEPSGRDYTYFTPEPVAVGDTVEVDGKQGISQGVVTAVNVPEEEIAPFKDRAKTIIGKVKDNKPKVEMGRCHYCRKERPMSELVPGEVSFIGSDPLTGKRKVMHETNLYCKDSPCHGYDQMANEG